jgi:hypothetical protein
MDETTLVHNAEPKRTLGLRGERWQDEKVYKDKGTVLFCCNADGSENFVLWLLESLKNHVAWKA